MADNLMQPSFAGGELSRNLWARVDLAKFHSGLALARNFFVDYRGGISTRPGTKYILRAKDSTHNVRVVSFQISTLQTFVLEFGHHYIRAYTDGEAVSDLSLTITGITNANPGVVTYTGTDPANGDWVFVSGVLGMTQLNGQWVIVSAVDTALNTFQLTDLNGNNINTTAYGVWISGGTADRIQVVTTTYNSADLFELKFVQSADVMTITHQNYVPADLTISGGLFSKANITFGTTTPQVMGLTTAATDTDNPQNYSYQITAVIAGQEGPPSTISTLQSTVLDPANTRYITMTWTAVTSADYYNVYKAGPNYISASADTVLGFIGQAFATHFQDDNIAPDFTRTPPLAKNPFASSNNPSCCTFYQQRKVFASSATDPQTLWMSQPGTLTNFDKSLVVLDKDSLDLAIASRQVNTIKDMIARSTGLVVLTSGGAFLVSGGTPTAAITPLSATALPQASPGISNVPPLLINDDILFVQNKGAIVRDLSYNFYTNSYYGTDRSALANHLFFGYSITDWTYAEEPFKIVWATRNDGILLSLTYVPEQEVYGWCRHDTNGAFRSTCSVVESDEDAVYFVVDRLVGGVTLKYIERMSSRKWTDVRDVWALDSALANAKPTPTGTLLPGAITGTGITFISSSGAFAVGCEGNILRGAGGVAEIITRTSSTHAVCNILQDFQDYYPNDAGKTPYAITTGNWTMTVPIATITGLQHLAGKTVSALADGLVVENLVVSASGGVTLPNPATDIIIGLPFQGQAQTLYLTVTGDGRDQAKRQMVPRTTLRVYQSRGFKVGADFDSLTEYKPQYPPPVSPEPFFSEDSFMNISPDWVAGAQVCIQQDYPLPMTLLGLMPEVVPGDTGR